MLNVVQETQGSSIEEQTKRDQEFVRVEENRDVKNERFQGNK